MIYDELLILVNYDFQNGMDIIEIKHKYNLSISEVFDLLGFKDEWHFYL
jgi:Mor family transcriptional regulator